MYLGLDLGTSGVKALLIDAMQTVIGSATAPLTVSRPHDGWSEQEPADWISATKAALAELREVHPLALGAVKGIGFSGQMHGATLLDASDEVLRPCILWNDTRSADQAAALDADPQFRALTGNIVFPGFTAPKLAWVRDNEPEIFKRVAKVLLPKDYLRLWLTGEHVSEMSDAAGTSWLDTGRRQWSDALLGATDLSVDHMPRLVEGSDVSGQLRDVVADELGLDRGVVVAGGAGDNAASAIGMGTVSPDAAFVSLGTSGVLFVSNASYSPNPDSAVHAFCHALPGLWHQMGVILSATDALNWYAGIAGRSAADLTGALGDRLQAPGDVTFLPYLSGERTPHNDAKVRGLFAGLSHGADQAALTRAVLEGVGFALRDNLDALRSAGAAPAAVSAVGGGARSDYWLKLIATVLDLPVEVPADGDFGAAFGAARLGLIAAEGLEPTAVCRPPAVARRIAPEASLRDAFAAVHLRYRALYPAVAAI
ncbi:xylulokinase [Oceanomicrobium pacificus]|uniref:Xylulose kinase n=1 Tax=Oceanomicrobium pacificus TaxID=2692916 RepID=A0A6B0TT90_9RHOB|nr:xylulokinase [Oceanomicrobium pacificus]MXU65989.1 xylulokinase [Oceanomicrobium pacificus]